MSDIQYDFKNLCSWLELNKLKLNVNKTKAMILTKERQTSTDTDIQLKIENDSIEIVEKHKYLGVIIDKKLKFNYHVDYICKKIAQKVGVLYRSGAYLSQWSRQTIYNTIVLPHFHYASTILYMANCGEQNRLQVLQNRAMRAILRCSRYESVNGMLKKLNWMNTKELLEYSALVFIHRIKLGLSPNYLNGKLKTFAEVHDHDTRSKTSFILEHHNTKSAQNTVFFKAVIAYNKLNNELKNMPLESFKSNLRKIYLSHRD